MASCVFFIRSEKNEKSKTKKADVQVRIALRGYVNGNPFNAFAQSGVWISESVWEQPDTSNKDKSKKKKQYIKDKYLEQHGEKSSDGAKILVPDYPELYAKHIALCEIKDQCKRNLNLLTDDEVQRLMSTIVSEKPKKYAISEWLQGVVDDYWADIKRKEDAEREKQEAEAKKESLNAYIARYIEEISNGTRLTNKGTIYKHGTVKAIKASMTQFAEFQQANGISLNFDDIDLEFYRQYTAWLTRKGYTLNSLGKCIKDIKVIMTAAKDDELTTNEAYKAKKFRVTAEEADNIYLTKEELEAIAEVDLSKMAKGYEIARDVFLAGCCLAQRVSDYNRLTPYNVVTEVHKSIGENDEIIKEEVTYIVIDQQKENVRVRIPANKMMLGLLAKYNNHLPYIWEQKLNQYIKVVAEMAGITEEVPITSTKGGKRETANIRKCDLVKTHTARRTGATLMYLSGMDLYDICKITGHTNIKNLRKYIKADELDVATKITKYDYFKN